ncbi:MAG: hypothetical protein HQL03_03145 [Nitrospirae bacterium]|nr:hypothetical protein [Nitrospirota bacterium]
MIFLGLLFCTAIGVDAADSSFTQADRDRMIRLEERMVRLEDRMNHLEERMIRVEERMSRLEERMIRVEEGLKATNQRIDDVRGLIYVMISVTMSGTFILIGFVLWDRRTTLAPVVRTTRELEDHTEKLTLAIKEKAEKDPELKEALRHAGLL